MSSSSAEETMLADESATVTVRAPGRLHLGFLDPSGSLGRRFGSLGLVINGFETEVELGASSSTRVSANGPAALADVERAEAELRLLQRHSGHHEPLHLRLVQVLPAHAGFGSGTQLALAIARAFAHWHGLDLSTARLAQWLGRGQRSGIGVAGFDLGGLLVDGGPDAHGEPPVMLSRIALPAEWRVLVVQDGAQRGLSGAAEQQAIRTLPPMPQAQAAEICHQVLMRVLPGAAGAEFAPFAAGVTHIQRLLGAHFAPGQGGHAFTSAAVGRVMDWIGMHEPLSALGQSSWGPTGFAILPSMARAEALAGALYVAGVVAPSLSLRIVSGRNTGATLVDRRPGASVR
ncbi:beta-ribofuranosylaminobenzene 5'-phosphate synthase family protein [Variovorax sp. dw_308]|uniref:beta-ribofuranosylaminobenzene 5'-phosphate synthase family protein n=1 Tax=Variovorax sp. dw_308 TaxID=2721546 RepID=UPI001C48CE5A|nr:beta-ribofuranosylaminobenzene 5'-phosphate synthase family protein [Variovorax sp. dw_308]